MSKESEIYERLATLEARDQQRETDVTSLLKWRKSCEEVVVKWGFKFMVLLGIGALFGGRIEEIKKAVLKWFL